ncbi:hypothetical protein [Sphaerochaeta sp.]|jgi:hypothetical protein|nr:hypothetical protein [Sphaerochaeta sp.]MDX9985425.1 hypothetical protein [Sphaerochaeta sp.]
MNKTHKIYAKADTELKSKAINALAPKIVGEGIQTDWNIDGDLMDFLSSV